MGNSSSNPTPQELVRFRKLDTAADDIDIPARSENRTITDKKGFVIFGIAILIFIPFFIYSLAKSDIRHYKSGYDDCGNFCGYENKKIEGIPCSGRNHTKTPYCVDFRSCNATCHGETYESKYCLSIDWMIEDLKERKDPWLHRANDYVDNIYEYPWRFPVTAAIILGLTILTLTLLRYATPVVVWGSLVFVIIFHFLGSLFLWLMSWFLGFYDSDTSYSRDDKKLIYHGLILIVFWTIWAVTTITILAALINKMKSVILLFKEAMTALTSMPVLLIVNVVTTIVQLLAIFAFMVTTYYMLSFQKLDKVEETYKYGISQTGVFTIALNLLMLSYLMRVISGINYMIISGSVSAWYFAKNKQYLGSPIITSCLNTFKYHLGTVALGSVILFPFFYIRLVVKFFVRFFCCTCRCFPRFDVIFNYLTEYSYIETSIHGQSYFRSAKRVTRLLLKNEKSFAMISSMGDGFLVVLILTLTTITSLVTFLLFISGLTMVSVYWCIFMCLVNQVIFSLLFNIIQVTIDTLIVCYFEDLALNDGNSKPYYTSGGFMKVIEETKRLCGEEIN